MSTTTISSALEANLAAVARHDAELAQRLREIEPSDQVAFAASPQGIPSANLGGRQLCSRHRPADEAKRLADDIDLIEHAVIVFLGFGLGYHIEPVANHLGDAGVIVIFEPDLALLRSVLEQVNHASWLSRCRIVWITEPTDRSALAQRLSGLESFLGQGVHFAEHPASRWRIPEETTAFTSLLREFMTSARTTLMTTLIRSIETVRNLILNVDHYLASPGIADLKDVAAGYPAVVVAAGPSLQKNMHLLAQPGVRDRCVIIAAQTTLKPLLAAGIKPHFVTALDIAQISKRFYEDLAPEDVEGVTLVVEPKAHPVILDAFPGPVRCSGSGFLDKLIGEHAREMGHVRPGATVAHLSVYLARHLGCDPVVMIGQDLGFTDGLYYSSGTAIHDVWTPELNPFNTIEMMEWQRIVRHRAMLHRLEDIDGKEIISDSQLYTYLAQFERDFAAYRREGVRIIDATEGGVRKQHAELMTLEAALREHAIRELPPLPPAEMRIDERTTRGALTRLGKMRRDIARIGETSRRTIRLLEQMMTDQSDRAKMDRHFRQVEKLKRDVESRQQAFDLVNQLNQLGMFKRVKADRRLQVQRNLTPIERQRAELQRDRENVAWIGDAAQELVDQLVAAERLLRGETIIEVKPSRRRINDSGELEKESDRAVASAMRVAALIPIDPERNGLGVRRSLAEPFAGRPVLQATLERLGRVRALESIILISPRRFDIESLIDHEKIGRPVEVEWLPEGVSSPFGPEQESIAAARRWAETCWRAGIAGMSVYDEVLCPQVMHPVMQKRGLTAALLCAPDWPLIDVSDDQGCAALIARHLEHPDRNKMVFTQAPPGLGGLVLAESLLRQFTARNRLSTAGGLMVYQPHVPQGDPIVFSNNVQIDHHIRRAPIRATFDAPTYRTLLRRVAEPIMTRGDDWSTAELIDAMEADLAESFSELPQHVIVELCTERVSAGPANRHPYGTIKRAPVNRELVERLCAELAEREDGVLTLDGVGDPLLHPEFDRIIQRAKALGVAGVHVRTDLIVSRGQIDRLLDSGVDVITVMLHADRAATYEAMTGTSRFREVLENMQYVLGRQRRLTAQKGTAALPMPWLVPRIQRRRESYHDIETFFDRWQHLLGAAVIEGPPPFDDTPECPADSLRPAITPERAMQRELDCRMMVLCDGSAVVSELDLRGMHAAGTIATQTLRELWREVSVKRRAWRADPASAPIPLRTLHP